MEIWFISHDGLQLLNFRLGDYFESILLWAIYFVTFFNKFCKFPPPLLITHWLLSKSKLAGMCRFVSSIYGFDLVIITLIILKTRMDRTNFHNLRTSRTSGKLDISWFLIRSSYWVPFFLWSTFKFKRIMQCVEIIIFTEYNLDLELDFLWPDFSLQLIFYNIIDEST